LSMSSAEMLLTEVADTKSVMSHNALCTRELLTVDVRVGDREEAAGQGRNIAGRGLFIDARLR
jgi:hypothetical protein